MLRLQTNLRPALDPQRRLLRDAAISVHRSGRRRQVTPRQRCRHRREARWEHQWCDCWQDPEGEPSALGWVWRQRRDRRADRRQADAGGTRQWRRTSHRDRAPVSGKTRMKGGTISDLPCLYCGGFPVHRSKRIIASSATGQAALLSGPSW